MAYIGHPIISVIIPVYNVADYIERCATSLFEQSLENIEFIFINDKTPDNSIDILKRTIKKYPHRESLIRIVEMPLNSRQAAARNKGLDVATGEYVIHCDPDDWIDPDLYESLYQKAKKDKCDITTCDYIEHYSGGKQVHSAALESAYPSEPLFKNEFFFPALWRHLIKRELIERNQIKFFKNINFMEDFGFIARILLCSQKIGHVHNAFYHYNKENHNSITTGINTPEIVSQRIKCLNLLDDYFLEHGLRKSELGFILRTKRDIKDLYLRSGELKKWRDLFPEVADWEFKNSEASAIYRMIYYLSHKVGSWPMNLLLKIKKSI